MTAQSFCPSMVEAFVYYAAGSVPPIATPSQRAVDMAGFTLAHRARLRAQGKGRRWINAAEAVFTRYNHGSPDEVPFAGRSMSVGDVVVLRDGKGRVMALRCEPAGWKVVVPKGRAAKAA